MKKLVRQSVLSYKALYAYADPRLFIAMMIVNPILQLTYFSFMAKFVYGTENLTYWFIGNAFLMATSNAVFVVGSLLRRERQTGTLKYILATPCNKFMLFFSRSILHILDLYFRVILGFLAGYVFFGFNLPLDLIPYLFIAISAGILSGLGFGMMISNFSLITTEIHLFLNSMEQMLILLTGALFPLSRLPKGLRVLSNYLPLTHSIEATRILSKYNVDDFFTNIGYETLLAIGLFLISYITFEVIHNTARRRATIDFY